MPDDIKCAKCDAVLENEGQHYGPLRSPLCVRCHLAPPTDSEKARVMRDRYLKLVEHDRLKAWGQG